MNFSRKIGGYCVHSHGRDRDANNVRIEGLCSPFKVVGIDVIQII